MKNYIQRIIRLFATSDPDPKLTGEIHRWLLDQEHAGEKETALHDLWNETEGKVDRTTWDSLGIYQSRSQLRGQTSATYPFHTLCGCHSVADRISFGHFSNDQTALCRSSPY